MEALSLVCGGLGIAEEDEAGNRIGYSKGENCLENIKDLLRFLRRDDPQTREVFKQVCEWKTVSKDLIPIIQYCQAERSLVLNAVKVLVFLTMPIEPSSHDIPQQTEYLWNLKSAITRGDTVGVIVSLLEGPLENLERESFTEDDWKLVQLVLTLFRNVLAIQDISVLQKVGGSASHLLTLRDRFLEIMFHENAMDLIIVITQHICDSHGYLRQDNLLILEIFHYIFMDQDPELIAKANLKDSKMAGDTKTSVDCLKSIMEEEEERRKLSRIRNARRHSHFSGTFTRLTMDGSKAVYQGNPSSASQSLLLKHNKIHRGFTKKIVWDHGRLPSTKDDMLVLLHDFLNQFLSGGYHILMQTVSEDIEKEHHAVQNSDTVVFFKVAQFVTSFQYHKYLTLKPNLEKDESHGFADECADSTLFKGDICGPIAASMNESMFLLIISRWRNAFDGLKETKDYKFLSAAGSLMKTMISMLDLVLKLLPEDSKEPQTARILLYKLFYDQTDQGMTQFILSLIKTFDTHKQPKSDLADLVEMIHVIVSLMENLQTRGILRVSKRSRKVKTKKLPGDKKESEKELSGDKATVQDQILSSNTENSNDLSISLERAQDNTISDDPGKISNVGQVEGPDDPGKIINVGQVEAPDDPGKISNVGQVEALGDPGKISNVCQVGGPDDRGKISNVGQVEGPEMSAQETGNLGQNPIQMDTKTMDQIDAYLTCSSDDSSGDEQLVATSEVDFKLSLLTTFYDILVEQKASPCKEYSNIVDFLTSLVRRMLRKMKNQPLLFVEILFWKSRKECHYIEAEYMLHELGHIKKEIKSWQKENHIADGEIGSSGAKEWAPRSIADALGEDEADVVISHEPYQNMDKTVEHEIKGVTQRKRRLVLTDELEMKIKVLYDKCKDDGNCSRIIAESLDPTGHVSPAQVFNKLKQLGLKVPSKKRLRHVDRTISSSDPLGDEGKTAEKESDVHNSVDLEGIAQGHSLDTRKRVRAFSKDQEEIIKVLFEQFKEHKRCCYMIANALGDDNSFTAAQISRKLKQLGLRVPRQRSSETKMHLRDEELDDFSGGKGQASDDETLSSLRNRSRNKDDGRSFDEQTKQNKKRGFSEDSDDEFLSSLLKHRNEDGDKSLSKEQNSGEVSDNEFLDSFLSKTRKLHPVAKSRKPTNRNLGDGIPKDVADRDVISISGPIGMDRWMLKTIVRIL